LRPRVLEHEEIFLFEECELETRVVTEESGQDEIPL